MIAGHIVILMLINILCHGYLFDDVFDNQKYHTNKETFNIVYHIDFKTTFFLRTEKGICIHKFPFFSTKKSRNQKTAAGLYLAVS